MIIMLVYFYKSVCKIRSLLFFPHLDAMYLTGHNDPQKEKYVLQLFHHLLII